MNCRRTILLYAAVIAVTALPVPSYAQTFPISGKPIRIVVPYAAGGQTDVQARAIGQKISQSLGVPVIVENKPGGSTLPGTREVQRAAPDGHTLLYTIASHVQLPHLYKKAPWDPLKDFTPITAGARSGTVLTVMSSMPFNTIPELIEYAKKNPGKLNFASFGVGSTGHLNGEILKRRAAIDIVHVPYKGSGEAMKDHLGGSVELFFDGPTTAISNTATGKVKMIAYASETRSTLLPDLPTLKEQGVDVGAWGYLWFWGPAGMKPAVVDTLYQHMAKAIQSPEIIELFKKGGSEAAGMPPAEMARLAQELSDTWGKAIKETGISLDQ